MQHSAAMGKKAQGYNLSLVSITFVREQRTKGLLEKHHYHSQLILNFMFPRVCVVQSFYLPFSITSFHSLYWDPEIFLFLVPSIPLSFISLVSIHNPNFLLLITCQLVSMAKICLLSQGEQIYKMNCHLVNKYKSYVSSPKRIMQ